MLSPQMSHDPNQLYPREELISPDSKKRPNKDIIFIFNIRYLAGCFEKYTAFKGDRADLCWGSSDNYRAVRLEGNQGRRWNDSNSSRDELEGYMVIQEASVVHSSVELEINQLIPG